MRVQYGEFRATVDDTTAPADVFATLKQSFTELTNGDFTVGTEAGEKVMKVFLKTGSKA